jgi:hypothetical protein
VEQNKHKFFLFVNEWTILYYEDMKNRKMNGSVLLSFGKLDLTIKIFHQMIGM